ncbi:MAG: hypothetical protein LBN20_03475 [Endomicrobium sp.]|nr:hypothetical protein [Endomicrobium sp.]
MPQKLNSKKLIFLDIDFNRLNYKDVITKAIDIFAKQNKNTKLLKIKCFFLRLAAKFGLPFINLAKNRISNILTKNGYPLTIDNIVLKDKAINIAISDIDYAAIVKKIPIISTAVKKMPIISDLQSSLGDSLVENLLKNFAQPALDKLEPYREPIIVKPINFCQGKLVDFFNDKLKNYEFDAEILDIKANIK